MAKWLALAGVALVALLLVLWREIGASDEPVKPREPGVQARAAPSPTAAKLAAQIAQPVAAAAAPPPSDGKPAKFDPKSDEFFYQFDEAVPRTLTRNAAKCYEGRRGKLHHDQKLILAFKTRIVNGEVQVRDVTVKESTLNDAALEACFLQEVQRSSWKNDRLPDWEQDDELVLRPEAGMKKYLRESLDDVGPVAPPQ